MPENHEYHEARNIYEKPRVCKNCGEQICNYPIPVHRGDINKPDEPNVNFDVQLYYCVRTLGHSEFHNNPKIRLSQRFQQ